MIVKLMTAPFSNRNAKIMNCIYTNHCTKMKFSVKDFFSKCDQIRRKLQILSHLLKKSLMENLIFLCSEWTYKRKKHGNDMFFNTYETIASMTKVIDFPNS